MIVTTRATSSTPAQIVRIGEDRASHLTPWLDELAFLSLDGPQPERFLRAQALLFSVLDVVVPLITTADTSNGRRGSTMIPAAPRHRQFTPLRVEARHVAQLIRDDPARQWTAQELAGGRAPVAVSVEACVRGSVREGANRVRDDGAH